MLVTGLLMVVLVLVVVVAVIVVVAAAAVVAAGEVVTKTIREFWYGKVIHLVYIYHIATQ